MIRPRRITPAPPAYHPPFRSPGEYPTPGSEAPKSPVVKLAIPDPKKEPAVWMPESTPLGGDGDRCDGIRKPCGVFEQEGRWCAEGKGVALLFMEKCGMHVPREGGRRGGG